MDIIVRLKGIKQITEQLSGLGLKLKKVDHYNFEVINTNATHAREALVIFFNIKNGHLSIKTHNIKKVSDEQLAKAIRIVTDFQKQNPNYNPFNLF